MLRTYRRFKERSHLLSTDIYSRWKWKKYAHDFNNIDTFCLFIGYPRSGHSLVGSLLDAHPNMLIANELDVLRYFDFGLSKYQLYYLLMRNSIQYAKKGRVQTKYNYDVPGQWQGNFTDLQIIGDKKGGMTTQRIGENFDLLKLFSKSIAIPIKYVHVHRNPFDNITTMALRTNSSLEKEIDHYFHLCSINRSIRELVKGNFLDIAHEDLINDTDNVMRELIDFLVLSATSDYIQACSNIVSKTLSNTRLKVEWPTFLKEKVQNEIQDYEFLHRYTFDS